MSRKIIFLSAMLISLFASFALAETISLPRTGMTTCWNNFGEEISCGGTGQDGEIQAGLSWPSPRFTVQGDCIVDSLTGLMWLKDIPSQRRTWEQAIDYAASLSGGQVCGREDWRLPNINELESLGRAGVSMVDWLGDQGFTNVVYGWYWSSTSVTNTAIACPGCAFIVDSGSGVFLVSMAYKYTNNLTEYVWPVAGVSDGPAKLWWTGQSTKYRPNDDGYLQEGVHWSGRFTTNGETVTDDLTGLVWTKDAHAPGPDGCSPAAAKTWQQALDYADCLNTQNYLGYSDWRIPNAKEWMSLFDRSQNAPALPQGHPFTNVVASGTYWTSTPDRAGRNAIVVTMDSGLTVLTNMGISNGMNAWPVRGGTINSVPVTLTGIISGNKKGSLFAAGLTCPAGKTTCTGSYNSGAEVTVTASALPGFAFNRWTGCDSVSDNVCQVTMDTTRTVTASFDTLPAIGVSPASLNFGQVAVGSSSTKTVAVTNKGGAHLVLDTIDISGTAEFAAAPAGCVDSLEKGEKVCTVAVTVTPTTYPAKAAQLIITSNDAKKPALTVSLAAGAVPPKITASPAVLNFGTIKVNTTSLEKKITVRNTGISNLSFTSIGLDGTDPFAVKQDDCTGKTLARNQSCVITFTFSPSDTNTAGTHLDIVSNDPEPTRTTMTVIMSGKGK